MGDISVVVGTFNRLDLIRKCVESVESGCARLDKLYVTDAGSTDGTVEYLRAIASEKVVPLFIGEKLGQAKAYNDVFRKIETRYVCWISDDNQMVAGALDSAAAILDSEPKIGMVGLKVKDLQGPFAKAPYIGGVSALGILNVNQGLLRTRIMREIGYFSETFRDYGIDPDLTAKVLLTGHDIVYTRNVAIHHRRLWETDVSSPAYAAMQKRQKVAQDLYRQKYQSAFPFAPLYAAKRAFWKALRMALGRRYRINSHGSVLGALPRDWNNVFATRYVSVFDALLCAGKPYHLRQFAPPRAQRLPLDPAPQTVS